MQLDTLIMKFGGAAVGSIEQFPLIADLIISQFKKYSRIVVVVSAMGETTNQLIELSKKVHPEPPQREYDMLISVGERISMSLLAMALCRKDHQAMSFTGSQSGIITCNNHANAKIVDVRPYRVIECLNQGHIAIVAGFQGVNQQKNITTLGRGGSDTTAVALGVALNACEVQFYKDVPGIFNEDPKKMPSVQHTYLSYDDALNIVNKGARVLHPRAVQLAQKNGLPLLIKSFLQTHQENQGTMIYEEARIRNSQALYEEVC
jgi:aspartate kinase